MNRDLLPGAPDLPSPTAPAASSAGVLVLDDDPAVAGAVRRILEKAGHRVEVMSRGTDAIAALGQRSFDVVVSDIMMPGLSGIDFLRIVRSHDLDVPVILMTGNPSIETAMEAVALGALQYLAKPVKHPELLRAVDRASKLRRLASVKREALRELGLSADEAGDRAGLEAGLDRALASMWIAFQPIVDGRAGGVLGYEALMRSAEASLPHPGAVLGAAERLDRLPDVGRRVRSLTADAFRAAAPGALLFINLHTRDLLDADLYDPSTPLSRLADRIVLEVTERAALDDVRDVVSRAQTLRAMGFRIAIDDLGAGYAGLSSIAALEPEFVKLDMSLVRGVHSSPVRQSLIGSIARLCGELGMNVVAEGIETTAERDTVRRLGCDLLQGYLFAKPGRPFPEVAALA